MNKITIKGKEYPCRVTMGSMIRYKNDTGREVADIDNKDMEGVTRFLYHSVKSACKVDDLEFDLEFEEFADHVTLVDIAGFGKDDNTDESSKAVKKK